MYIIQISAWTSAYETARITVEEALRRVCNRYHYHPPYVFTDEQKATLLAHSEKVLIYNNDYPSTSRLSAVVGTDLKAMLDEAIAMNKAVIHNFTNTDENPHLQTAYGSGKIYMECVDFEDTQSVIRSIKIDELCS